MDFRICEMQVCSDYRVNKEHYQLSIGISKRPILIKILKEKILVFIIDK